VEGKVQIEGEVIHVIAQKLYDLSKLLRQLTPAQQAVPSVNTLARPDETSAPSHNDPRSKMKPKEEGEEKVFYGGRNFK